MRYATLINTGSPPIWAPLTKNRKLNQDTGDIFRDQNAARYPKYPFEPAVRAIFTMQPQLRPDEVDVVACGSTMGNLLRLARSKEVDFRFNVEFIGNSVFFVRKENTPTDVIQGLYGYGHTFPQAYTQWEADTKGSASHQRIIKYKFGGTRCLIRFESDLWLPERLSEEELALAKCDTSLSKVNSEAGDDDSANVSLLDAIGSVSIGQNMPTIKDDLMIKQGGRKIPQKAVFDLKTRSFTRRIDMADVLPRLWVSQTPNFLIGYHKAGVFDEIRIEDLYQDIKDWERDNEHSLRRLEAIVRRIVEIARSSKGQGLEVSRLGNGPLLVRRLLDTTWHALPTDLCEKWDLNGSET